MSYLEDGITPRTIKKKDIPDLKKKAFIPADMEYVYLEHALKFPFRPNQLDYCPVNAWWLAECSYLAYTHPGFARMVYKLAGFEGFRFFNGKGTECMVAWHHECSIVSFRGTELGGISTIRELSTDLDATSIPFPLGGHVHRGFYRAQNEVWGSDRGLSAFLQTLHESRPTRPMWITGHSLGGALATLTFSLMPSATGLYIYGSPRVGDSEFIALMDNRPVWRVENERDPIVLLPPDVPKLGFEYLPVGRLKYLDKTGQLFNGRPKLDTQAITSKAKRKLCRQISGFFMIFKRIKARWQTKSKNARNVFRQISDHVQKSAEEWRKYLLAVEQQTGLRIDDHMPIYYAVKLWNLVIKAKDTKSAQ